jgi:hypothetical protein
MNKQQILNKLRMYECQYDINTSNNQLTVVAYFHEAQKIKREIFKNSDYALIRMRQDGKFNLTTLLNK